MKFPTQLTRSVCLAAAVATIVACAARRPQGGTSTAGAEPPRPVKVAALGRAELWEMHCTRCHNLRPRAEYSPAQWAIAVNHMRAVADLPGEDYRALLEYLADRQPTTATTRPPRGSSGGGSR